MRYLTVLSLLALALGAGGATRAGDIYCENQGKDCSDRPTPGAQFKGSTSTQAPASSAPTAPAASSANSTAAATDAAANARLSQDASRAAVQKDVAAIRADQCKEAQDKYQKSIDGASRVPPEQGRRARVPVRRRD